MEKHQTKTFTWRICTIRVKWSQMHCSVCKSLCAFGTGTEILVFIWRTLYVKQRFNVCILHISHDDVHSLHSFRLSLPQRNSHSDIAQKTNLTLSCYRYTRHREATVEREGEREKRTTVLALSHFAESQPRHRHCRQPEWVKFGDFERKQWSQAATF